MKTDISKLNRINVVGVSGSGKSTFTRQLAELLDIPNFHMDELYWKDDWTHCDDKELAGKVIDVTSRDKWILDGNYHRTHDYKWRNVQTLIWLDYPFWIVFYRIMKRSIKRAFTRERLWGTNNYESFLLTFFNKESIVWWMISTFNKQKERYVKVISDNNYNLQTIRLTSQKETDDFIDMLKAKRND